jgi:uncharacterized membrane protein (UPF0127 family)
MRRRDIAGLLAVLLLAFVVPAALAEDTELPRSELLIESGGERHHFEVELAETRAQMMHGLMFRTDLADDAGMLFSYPRPQPVAMWMKNTLIPLDMLFIDKDGAIIRIARWTVPLSLESIPSGGPVRAVLELKGGITERLGIEVGDRVIHPYFDG